MAPPSLSRHHASGPLRRSLRARLRVQANILNTNTHQRPRRPTNVTATVRNRLEQTNRRLRAGVLAFRYDILSYYRERAYSHLYHLVFHRQRARRLRGGTARQSLSKYFLAGRKWLRVAFTRVAGRTSEPATAGTSIGAEPWNRSLRALSRSTGGIGARLGLTKHAGKANMTMPYFENGNEASGSEREPGREPGARRKKMFGYLKAANELRQSYTQQLSERLQGMDEEFANLPGTFPEYESSKSGSEQMVLFPSYGKVHVKTKPEVNYREYSAQYGIDPNDPQLTDELEFWRQDWERYEQKNAIVDVDVTGWLFSPHQGPLNRRNKLLITFAKRMAGIPNQPSNQGPSTPSNPDYEQMSVDREVQSIISSKQALQRSDSNQFMTQEQINNANNNLMRRIRPFLAYPLSSVPITAFFFDDTQSQSRTVYTNDGGYFFLRVALHFKPTSVCVLALEDISAAKPVDIVAPTGVGLISDIDDTVKHSGITQGAKEIFQNTFVREPSELVVDGVREWYNSLKTLGVDVHYVSSSPWQLYPQLREFFKVAGLPEGSYHLKQYTGMLQGIFEPTTEKKRPALEKIFGDFPQKKFVLVGDSGESDLETYTEIALSHPGRVLAIFIRDIITNPHRFFDGSAPRIESTPDSQRSRKPPPLPPRPPPPSDAEDLIDLSDTPSASSQNQSTTPSFSRTAPSLPPKPDQLRRTTENIRRKPAPPLPSKPVQLSRDKSEQRPVPPPPPPRSSPGFFDGTTTAQDGYSALRTKATEIYNQLPPARAYIEDSIQKFTSSRTNQSPAPPPPPPRRNNNSVSGSSSRFPGPPQPPWRLSTPEGPLASPGTPSSPLAPSTNPGIPNPPSRREEMWNRRWARASEIMSQQGVVLSSWRSGNDVEETCQRLVKKALRNGTS